MHDTHERRWAAWSDENKYASWLEVELAASEALAETGEVPVDAARKLRAHAAFEVERIFGMERGAAEARCDRVHDGGGREDGRGGFVGEASRWLHYGLTSNDVVDTAQALQLKQASALLLEGVDELLATLKARAGEFRATPQIGRTHGIQAEPITFGLKIALWWDQLRQKPQAAGRRG